MRNQHEALAIFYEETCTDLCRLNAVCAEMNDKVENVEKRLSEKAEGHEKVEEAYDNANQQHKHKICGHKKERKIRKILF